MNIKEKLVELDKIEKTAKENYQQFYNQPEIQNVLKLVDEFKETKNKIIGSAGPGEVGCCCTLQAQGSTPWSPLKIKL